MISKPSVPSNPLEYYQLYNSRKLFGKPEYPCPLGIIATFDIPPHEDPCLELEAMGPSLSNQKGRKCTKYLHNFVTGCNIFVTLALSSEIGNKSILINLVVEIVNNMGDVLSCIVCHSVLVSPVVDCQLISRSLNYKLRIGVAD